MKTLEELNQKIWYRLLKVIFIIFSFAILFFYNFYIFKISNLNIEFKKLNTDKSIVKCLYGIEKSFKYSEICAYCNKNDFSEYKFAYDEYITKETSKTRKIINICYGFDNIFKENPNSPESYNEQYINYIKKYLYLSDDYQLFTIIPVYSMKNAIMNIFLYIIIGNLLMIFIAEIIKRAFYYIITGNIRPNKK